MRWWAQCQYHCKTITGGDHAEARIIDSSLMWNIRIHPATKPTSVPLGWNALKRNSSQEGHCWVIDFKHLRVSRNWDRTSEMIGANLTADQKRGEKRKRNRKRRSTKRQKQEDGTTPTNLRVWCEVLVQTWHRLLIVHAQVSSVPPGTSHACLFHSLEQTYYSRFFPSFSTSFYLFSSRVGRKTFSKQMNVIIK